MGRIKYIRKHLKTKETRESNNSGYTNEPTLISTIPRVDRSKFSVIQLFTPAFYWWLIGRTSIKNFSMVSNLSPWKLMDLIKHLRHHLKTKKLANQTTLAGPTSIL